MMFISNDRFHAMMRIEQRLVQTQYLQAKRHQLDKCRSFLPSGTVYFVTKQNEKNKQQEPLQRAFRCAAFGDRSNYENSSLKNEMKRIS